MKPPMLKDVKKTKPRLRSVTHKLPGGWISQTTEPDGEATYSEEQMDEAVREIAKPLIHDLLTQLEREVEKGIDLYLGSNPKQEGYNKALQDVIKLLEKV